MTGNLTTGLSDHLTFFIIVKIIKFILQKSINYYQRDSINVDKNIILQEVKSINWEVLETERSNVDYSFGTFMSKINDILDKYMP